MMCKLANSNRFDRRHLGYVFPRVALVLNLPIRRYCNRTPLYLPSPRRSHNLYQEERRSVLGTINITLLGHRLVTLSPVGEGEIFSGFWLQVKSALIEKIYSLADPRVDVHSYYSVSELPQMGIRDEIRYSPVEGFESRLLANPLSQSGTQYLGIELARMARQYDRQCLPLYAFSQFLSLTQTVGSPEFDLMPMQDQVQILNIELSQFFVYGDSLHILYDALVGWISRLPRYRLTEYSLLGEFTRNLGERKALLPANPAFSIPPKGEEVFTPSLYIPSMGCSMMSHHEESEFRLREVNVTLLGHRLVGFSDIMRSGVFSIFWYEVEEAISQRLTCFFGRVDLLKWDCIKEYLRSDNYSKLCAYSWVIRYSPRIDAQVELFNNPFAHPHISSLGIELARIARQSGIQHFPLEQFAEYIPAMRMLRKSWFESMPVDDKVQMLNIDLSNFIIYRDGIEFLRDAVAERVSQLSKDHVARIPLEEFVNRLSAHSVSLPENPHFRDRLTLRKAISAGCWALSPLIVYYCTGLLGQIFPCFMYVLLGGKFLHWSLGGSLPLTSQRVNICSPSASG